MIICFCKTQSVVYVLVVIISKMWLNYKNEAEIKAQRVELKPFVSMDLSINRLILATQINKERSSKRNG